MQCFGGVYPKLQVMGIVEHDEASSGACNNALDYIHGKKTYRRSWGPPVTAGTDPCPTNPEGTATT